MIEDNRIYVVVAGTVQVPAPRRNVVQPPGRQIAQACHVVSKLRINDSRSFILSQSDRQMAISQQLEFKPLTTIILQARDSAELRHIQSLLLRRKIHPTVFFDTNNEAYGPNSVMTALAVLATKKQIENILDYLPLWGSNV
jgi:hypothetical protein